MQALSKILHWGSWWALVRKIRSKQKAVCLVKPNQTVWEKFTPDLKFSSGADFGQAAPCCLWPERQTPGQGVEENQQVKIQMVLHAKNSTYRPIVTLTFTQGCSPNYSLVLGNCRHLRCFWVCFAQEIDQDCDGDGQGVDCLPKCKSPGQWCVLQGDQTPCFIQGGGQDQVSDNTFEKT